jgi:DNA polymerase III epsilon subunit-like protein
MKRPYTQPKFGLAVDWETSGADWNDKENTPKRFQGISFGAIVFNAETFEPIEEIYHEIQFDDTKYEWDMGAQKIHGLSREYLKDHGVSREEAAVALAELVMKYWGPDSDVMFLGHNAHFDINFTNQLFVDHGLPKLKLHNVVLDTAGTGFISIGLFKSDQLFEYLGFDKRGNHNSLDDIRMTLQTCQLIRGFTELGAYEALGKSLVFEK